MTVDRVQAGIGFEPQCRTAPDELTQRRRRLVAPALDTQLGCVDLDESHPDAVREQDRVPVTD